MEVLKLAGAVINTTDPDALATFYEALLSWPRLMDEEDWIALRHPDGGTAIAFQRSPDVVSPTWPTVDGKQQMVIHLDVTASDLGAAVDHARSLGALEAEFQSSDNERILIDPAGNPFCIIQVPTA